MKKRIAGLLAGLSGAVAGGAVVLAAASGPEDMQGRWSLVEIASRPVHSSASSSVPWFAIKQHAIEGFDGCNEFSGSLDTPGSIAATRRGCPDGAVKLPLDLADPMPQLKAGRVVGDRLVLPAVGTMPGFVMRKSP
jgi:heat shock protein HslJ